MCVCVCVCVCSELTSGGDGETGADVAHHVWVRGGGHGEEGTGTEEGLDVAAEAEEGRTEVVGPLGNAVGFVDTHQSNGGERGRRGGGGGAAVVFQPMFPH